MSNEKEEESKDSETGTRVPENIDKLLKKEKRKQISKEERKELFGYLENVEDIRGLVTGDPYNFSERDYARMMKSKVRHGSRQKAGKALKDPAGVLRAKESEDFDAFITDFWAQARDIGTNIIQKYAMRASELGYYDEDLEMIDMRDFTEDAMEFFVNQRPKVKKTREWLAAYRASFNATRMIIKKHRQMIQRLAMFVMNMAKEHDVPAEELTPVRGILTEIVGGETVAGRK